MARTAVLIGIGIAIAAIIGGIAVLTYSDETDLNSEPEVNTEVEEPGKVIELRLGEAATAGEAP